MVTFQLFKKFESLGDLKCIKMNRHVASGAGGQATLSDDRLRLELSAQIMITQRCELLGRQVARHRYPQKASNGHPHHSSRMNRPARGRGADGGVKHPLPPVCPHPQSTIKQNLYKESVNAIPAIPSL